MSAPGPLTAEQVFDRAPFSRAELKALAPLYSRFYRAAVEALAPELSRLRGVDAKAAAVAAREALVPLSHFYLDRLLRLDRFVASGGSGTVGAPPPEPFPARPESFTERATFSPAFNQAGFARAAPFFGLPVAPAPAPAPERPAHAAGFRNFNFTPSTLARKARRVALVLARLAGGARPLPALSLAYSTQALKDEGFFPALLVDLRGRAPLEDGRPDAALRAELARAAAPSREAMTGFLAAAGPRSRDACARAVEAWPAYVAEAFPSSLLEALPGNVAACAALLRPYAPRPLLVGEARNLESTAMLAAARSLGLRTVGFQHGGHYGYIAGLASLLEQEYGHFDRFVTWGWEEGPDRGACPGTRFTPLANPWLSERRALLREGWLAGGASREHDALFLSSRVDRYARAPSGHGNPSRDALAAYCRFLRELGSGLRGSGLRVLHKPFHAQVVAEHEAAAREMEARSEGVMTRLETSDKGLSAALLARCRVVVWDQPGTGFIECLAAGVPTLCLWPRTCIEEEEEARPFFAALEDAGIVSTSPGALLRDLKACLAGPEDWLARPGARAAVAAFLERYGRTSDDWPRLWRGLLGELGA